MSVGAPQQVLSGKYRLERELGRGGMGSVWLAQHLTLRSPVAIKLIDPGIASNPEALQRFLREAQAAASLRSPHVVQILDHGVDEGVPFIVMELLEGESLASRLERQRRLSPVETSRIMTQVCRAMARAHEAGIVHRDLKPDNIFLVRNDEDEIAKVLDFGVAKATSHGMGSVSGATRTGSVLGTPYYMSPEQAEGAKTVDQRSDLWSLGVIAWECIIGTRPFDSETLGGLLLAICARDIPVPSSVGPVPPGFDAWFGRACARNVALRFNTAKELATELRQVCGSSEAIGHYAPSPPVSSNSGPVAQAASLPLASTTGHLGMSASSEPIKKKSAAPLVAFGAVVALLGVGGAVFAMRGGADEGVASATPIASAAPAEQKAPPAPVAEPPAAAIAAAAVASSAPAPAASPAPAPATAAVKPSVRPRAAAVVPKPAKVEKPAAAAAPAAAPAPATTAKPRINLGI